MFPHGRLYDLTPNEVLDGIIPDKDRFRKELVEARKTELNKTIESNAVKQSNPTPETKIMI